MQPLLIVAILALVGLAWYMYRREGYDVCHGHCLKNSSGLVEDVWDCCECRATTHATYNQGFRECMCDSGYKDYCFRPV